MRNKFENINYPFEFWEAVKRYAPKNRLTTKIPIETWENYYKNYYGSRIICRTHFFGIGNQYLDNQILLHELYENIRFLKDKKQRGQIFT